MLEVLRQGSAQGDLPEDVDHELIADLLYGPVHYRFLISAAPVDPPLAEQLVDAVIGRCDMLPRRAAAKKPAPTVRRS
jgi:hypothetical protein